MGYSMKWIHDRLGITRDMIRYYEKEKLLPPIASRNPVNNYRDFSETDIERIWGIKLLIGIGFSVKEIRSLMYESDFDFETAIAQKVADLEKKHDEDVAYLEFAKSIKFSGRVPNVTCVGSMRFDEFLDFVRTNWNFYNDPKTAPFMHAADLILTKTPDEWTPDDFERVLSLAKNFEPDGIMQAYAINGYYQIIADMYDFGYQNETVQRIVRLLHEYTASTINAPNLDAEVTPAIFAKNTAPFFLAGDVASHYKRMFGEERCKFIAQAIAHYGGMRIDEL